MKIKINGEITAQRLARILEDVATKCGPEFKGIYGVNLYLNLYTIDGEPLVLKDAKGEEVMLLYPMSPGAAAKPALSEEALERKEAAKQARLIEQERSDASMLTHRRSVDQYYADERAKHLAEQARHQVVHSVLNEKTSKLMSDDALGFVAALNDALRHRWKEGSPMMAAGPNKGKPRALPQFSTENGNLMFTANGLTAKPRVVGNPYQGLGDRRGPIPHMNIGEWDKAMADVSLTHYTAEVERIARGRVALKLKCF